MEPFSIYLLLLIFHGRSDISRILSLIQLNDDNDRPDDVGVFQKSRYLGLNNFK